MSSNTTPIPTYRYECPSGHLWNVGSGRLHSFTVCPACGYVEDEGRGPIVDHGLHGKKAT